MRKRFVLMDSARGVAAAFVVFIHCWTSFSNVPNYRMMHLIFAKFPVIMFFVLSGFVLSYSIENSLHCNKILLDPFIFYIKRIFRIIPLIAFSLIFAFVISRIYTVPMVSCAADGLKYFITKAHEITVSGIINNIFLVDTYLNPPLWTMRAELAYCLSLPLFFYIYASYGKVRLFVILGLAIFMYFSGTPKTWEGAFSWFFPFCLGGLILFLRKEIMEFRKAAVPLGVLLGIISCVVLIPKDVQRSDELLLSLLASGIIIFCLWSEGTVLGNFFSLPPFLFLGRISFSLYLLHAPCIFLNWVLLEKYFPGFFKDGGIVYARMGLFFFTSLVSVPVAFFAEKYVERPFNKYGHFLSARIVEKGFFSKI